MTDEQFCRFYTAYYGECIDKVGQLVQTTLNGEELKELIEFFIKQNNLNEMKEEAQKELEKIEEDNKVFKSDFSRSIAIFEDIAMQLNSTKGKEYKLWGLVMDLYNKKYRTNENR